ncbi:sn-glycerol-3-phosphate import ATP-binding protein UgpC [Mesorhizobium microcysteis]|jgi:sn-glycerol 3-phosphate transport system ATP-binding protein|uniref:sn-glycerol-3-phosphate import ATP-binding protein UgpC n=1 Tax=Neoaquamicrobium microcysteis TaxID=2682781 RepID=A0A5D4GQ62_9HYPH|nr:sn-glycerol-3-phosphate import ATP-binding protein UgpC [Mesorhizobium microcysteis]TYR30497.1 sn-glycerol-3-phosphate import ATP-binding protein UgpC [Mesorhizobium microcysteis]
MATVELKDVRKTYGGRVEAVKGVSIDIPDGAMCVLVGPSGCGKSTLLRMIAGLEEITSGTVSIGGEVVNTRGPAERDIAMVFQNYALYPHMKVYDNMAYGLRNRGMAKDEIDRRVREAAATLGLAELLERRPRELSGGQRQRVAMGRAIVRSPKAFLFDEPLSNLDAKLRGQMRIEIKNLQRALGVTSVYVTHDQVEAMTLADTLVVMNGGIAEQIDTPMAIYEKPASIFVAGFIGSPAMNLLAAHGAEQGKGLTLASGGAIKPRDLAAPEAGRQVLLGVRPEHLTLVSDSKNADIEMKVTAVETLGADTLAHGRPVAGDARGGELIARLPGSVRISEDDVLPLAIDAGAAHLFDAGTGKRI